jgi:molybdopterin-guanine dinucleotide biosynthesis protein B
MSPIVSIVGDSKSGKTTLIEKLISELKSRGYRVAAIKHTIHHLDFDKPGKDSWRHLKAGSDAVTVVSPDQIVTIKPVSVQPDLEETARLLGDNYDIVLAEGFKDSLAPKVEVHRKVVGPPLSHLSNLIAIVTDEPLHTKIRQFYLDDIKGLADLLENAYIKPR